MAAMVGCHKPCLEPDYSFSIKASFTPEKDSIHVGDTLWLISETSTQLNDITTNAKVNYENAQNLGSTLGIIDIKKAKSMEFGAIDSFTYIKVTGKIYTDKEILPSVVKQLLFEERNGKYELKAGIIAQKKGSYIFSVGDAVNVFRKGKPKCGIAHFDVLNGNSNQHLYFFEDLWGSLSEYDKKHDYCFVVME